MNNALAILIASAPAKPDAITKAQWDENYRTANPPPEFKGESEWMKACHAVENAIRAAGVSTREFKNLNGRPQAAISKWEWARSKAWEEFKRDWPATWAKRMYTIATSEG